MAMYHCFGCERWIDNDYDPMDEDGECGSCQEIKNEEGGPERPLVLVTHKGVTCAYSTVEHARQGLLGDAMLWCSMAYDNETKQLLKEKGEIVGNLPTYH